MKEDTLHIVSVLAPIKEYRCEGGMGVGYKWLQCSSYPINHEPSWGNLIFVPATDVAKFTRTLNRYVIYIYSIGFFLDYGKKLAKRIPSAKKLYQLIKRV